MPAGFVMKSPTGSVKAHACAFWPNYGSSGVLPIGMNHRHAPFSAGHTRLDLARNRIALFATAKAEDGAVAGAGAAAGATKSKARDGATAKIGTSPRCVQSAKRVKGTAERPKRLAPFPEGAAPAGKCSTARRDRPPL
jgi:hypothetical protein